MIQNAWDLANGILSGNLLQFKPTLGNNKDLKVI